MSEEKVDQTSPEADKPSQDTDTTESSAESTQESKSEQSSVESEATTESASDEGESSEESSAEPPKPEAEEKTPPPPPPPPPVESTVVRERVSPAGLFFAGIIGLVIGWYLHSLVGKNTAPPPEVVKVETRQQPAAPAVDQITPIVEDTLSDAEEGLAAVLESLESKNYGSAEDQLAQVIKYVSRARNLAVDEKQKERLQQLSEELTTLQDQVKAVAVEAVKTAKGILAEMTGEGEQASQDEASTAPEDEESESKKEE